MKTNKVRPKETYLNAVELKRTLQRLAEDKLKGMSAGEQIDFLQKKFGPMVMRPTTRVNSRKDN